MSITTVSEFKQWRLECWRKEDEAAILGAEFVNEDEGRYQMYCSVEELNCSNETPCTDEDMYHHWDRHLYHIEAHCEDRTCSHCYVLDSGRAQRYD